jgi:dihydropteroate synthase
MVKSINCRGKILDFNTPKVMGILNFTPDSFSDGGRFFELEKALNRIDEMNSEGADIIDIGAVSSRPGAQLLNAEEEKKRLDPLLTEIPKAFPDTIFSLDTYNASVADWAVNESNIAIINDISAGSLDAEMYNTIAKLQVPYIIMHMLGTPKDMQNDPVYDNVTQDIILYFSKKIDALKSKGIHDIIIDPGFGFGKTLEHNYQLMKELEYFKIFDQILLAGISRKTMIQKALKIDSNHALNGTSILNTIALSKSAKILRVHDVKEASEAVKLTKLIY